MSEAMSSGEIEDVLSSIRRLVSEDHRPASQTAAKPAARTPEPPAAPLPLSRIVAADTPAPEPKKLLLTPALRVVSSDPAPAAPAEPVAQRPMSHLYRPKSPELTGTDARDDGLFAAIDLKPRKPSQDMNDVVSTIATAVDEADSQWESETGDASFDGLDWETPLWEDDTAQPEAPLSEAAPEADTRMAVPAAEASVDEAASFDLRDDPPEEAVSLNAMSPEAEEWEASDDTDPASAETAAPPLFSRRFVQEISDKAEAEAVAEILRATQAEDHATQDREDSGYSDLALTYDVDQDADGGYADNQGGYFDEAVLRDLVRDLIREELSGTLGERITRNVRKLVRAEINRALTARDFE
jgi:hypothetical protein